MRAVSVLRRAVACLVASAAFATLGRGAHAASFDCTKASSGMERLVCGDAALGARDEIMARLYAAALKTGEREAVGTLKRSGFGVRTYVSLIGDELHLTIAGAFERQD